MDPLSQHEAFLRAIFDSPDDDTPRLVYADFLEENGDEDRAAFIRLSCEFWRLHDHNPSRAEILTALNELVGRQLSQPWPWKESRIVRGFPEPLGPIPLLASYQEDLNWLRRAVVTGSPEWFGVKAVRFSPDETRLGPVQVDLFMVLPFTQQVTEWDLSGNIEEGPAVAVPATGTYALIEMNAYPVTTTAGVEALAKHRGARRITSLDLRNNNLDNDAARALVRSPYLHNLKRLRLLEGNRLRGRVWQQVIERFGEDVVG